MPEQKQKEMSGFEFLCHYVKEIIGAAALIVAGVVLLYYAPLISEWMGNKVQEAADSALEKLPELPLPR